jgi:DNA polymerase-1
MTGPSPSSLYIIDGHAQFFRAYYAIRGGMASPVTGEPTQMVYGFVGMLLKLLAEQKPTHLVLVVDASGDRGTFRSQIYPEYKSHRDPPPEDFGPQAERCMEFARLAGIPLYALEEVEADDVIATLVRKARRADPDMRIRIVSKDKDLSQLLDDGHISLFDPQSGQDIGPEQLFETKGVRPGQVVDMLALMGDSVDNVPGVPGIGPKTAASLITTYGSLEGVLDNLDKLTPKRRESIEAARDQLPLARRLVALKDDCDVPLELDGARVDPRRGDPSAAVELLRVLGFGRLREQAANALGVTAAGSSPEATPANRAPPAAPRRKAPKSAEGHDDAAGTLFARDVPESSGTGGQASAGNEEGSGAGASIAISGKYACIRDRESLDAAVRDATSAARAGTRVAFDTETDSLSTVHANLCGISLSWSAGAGVYIPVRGPEGESHLALEQVRDAMAPFLADESLPKCAHNAKFDLQILQRHGMPVKGLAGDSMVASHLADSSRASHGLDGLSESVLGHRCIPITALIGSGAFQRTFDTVTLDVAAEYAAEDADIAGQLDRHFHAAVVRDGMERLYRDVELPLVQVLADMELAGIGVDGTELDRQRVRLQGELEALREAIARAAPHPFSPDSPKQLAAALFNKPTDVPPGLGLRVVKRTKTGASTDAEVLEKLAADPSVESEIPARIVEYRQLSKLVGTYLVALRDAIDPGTGRIHASFHQAGTATGRLSSSDPNLQNIPIRTEVGRDIRRAFVAQPGHVLLSCDYSQIELRVLAHLSEDPALCEAFRRDADIHVAVAAEVFGVAPKDVTDAQRGAAKMVNFGIVYGITPFGLARRLGSGTSLERARDIIEGYRARFARIDAFLVQCVQHAKDHGHVETVLGRRRPVPQVHSRNPAERALGERIAINTVVQGSAADLIKVAMVRIAPDLGRQCPGARLLLQIHDELLFEVPEPAVASLQAWVVERMETAMDLRVPLRVGAASGANWFEAS